VRRHIHLLHEYNEVRDVAMGLMGLVAENRGVTVGVVIKGTFNPRFGGRRKELMVRMGDRAWDQ
jgi:hypothetical protein